MREAARLIESGDLPAAARAALAALVTQFRTAVEATVQLDASILASHKVSAPYKATHAVGRADAMRRCSRSPTKLRSGTALFALVARALRRDRSPAQIASAVSSDCMQRCLPT